jgi:hypothetical protein
MQILTLSGAKGKDLHFFWRREETHPLQGSTEWPALFSVNSVASVVILFGFSRWAVRYNRGFRAGQTKEAAPWGQGTAMRTMSNGKRGSPN